MDDKITILMATYNGERFLSEQLDSIIAQTYTNWELWIRDDYSSDNTLNIIKEYCIKDNRIKYYKDDLKNIGCVLNFGKLLEKVPYDNYVMFCDQDDVWLPFKVEITLTKMKEQKHISEKPILIYSPLQKVDNNLVKIQVKKYDLPKEITINKIISQNFIYGCTMMINKKLIELVNPISDKAENHDYWIALIAAYSGVIASVDEATILYRQHENNVSGNYKDCSFNRRMKRLFNGQYTVSLENRLIMIEALVVHLKKMDIKTSFFEEYVKYMRMGGIKSVIYIIKNKIYKYGTGLPSNIMHLITAFNYKSSSK